MKNEFECDFSSREFDKFRTIEISFLLPFLCIPYHFFFTDFNLSIFYEIGIIPVMSFVFQ